MLLKNLCCYYFATGRLVTWIPLGLLEAVYCTPLRIFEAIRNIVKTLRRIDHDCRKMYQSYIEIGYQINFYIKTRVEEGIREDTKRDGRAKFDNGCEIWPNLVIREITCEDIGTYTAIIIIISSSSSSFFSSSFSSSFSYFSSSFSSSSFSSFFRN